MVEFHSASTQHLLQLAVADGIEAVPTHSPKDDVWREMTPFERRLGVHGGGVGG